MNAKTYNARGGRLTTGAGRSLTQRINDGLCVADTTNECFASKDCATKACGVDQHAFITDIANWIF